MDSFSFARSVNASRASASHFSLNEEFEMDSALNLDQLSLPLLGTVLPPIDPERMSAEDFFLPPGEMFAALPLEAQVCLVFFFLPLFV